MYFNNDNIDNAVAKFPWKEPKPNRIKALRKKYRLTQKQLGILMGYSRDQIYRVESGKRQITPHFESSLENIEMLLKSGSVSIPK